MTSHQNVLLANWFVSEMSSYCNKRAKDKLIKVDIEITKDSK